MKRLTFKAFNRARNYLLTRARPLERELFCVHFEGASLERAMAELGKYQNSDGGFGRALEADMRTPSSSALATAIGLRTLVDIGCPASSPLVSKAIAFLMASFNEDTRVWRVIPVDANDHPHAPWWHDEDGSLARTFENFWIIPRVNILASMHHYVGLIPQDWLDKLTGETIRYIEAVPILGNGGGSDLEYVIHLAGAQNLNQEYVDRLQTCLKKAISAAIERDSAKWDAYCTKPLSIISSPQQFGADLIRDALELNLDYQIEHQTLEGCWEPNWHWHGMYPETWEQARWEWCGHLTLETLTQLRAFDWIEKIG